MFGGRWEELLPACSVKFPAIEESKWQGKLQNDFKAGVDNNFITSSSSESHVWKASFTNLKSHVKAEDCNSAQTWETLCASPGAQTGRHTQLLEE